MTIFSLLTVFSATAAWFGMNKDVDTSGTNINVVNPNGKLDSIEFFTFKEMMNDGIDNTGFKFNTTAVGSMSFNYATETVTTTGDTSISLDNFTLLNPEHPLLLIFNLNGEYSLGEDEFIIRALTERTSFLGERSSIDGSPVHDLSNPSSYLRKDETTQTAYYALSSVARFLYQELSDDDYATLTSGTSLDFAYTSLTNNENFVSIDNATETSSFNSNPTFYASTNNTVSHVALVIDYFNDAIEYIYSTYLGDDVLEDTYDYILHFECDWSMEVFG